MKQIYYLTSVEKKERFDAVFESMDGISTFYDISKMPSLVAFVQRERAINGQDFLLIDLQEADFSTAHLLNAIQFLRKFSVAELIFIGGDDGATTQTFGSLSESFRIRNLIVDKTETETVALVRAALLGQTSPLAYMEKLLAKATSDTKRVVSPLQIPAGLIISLGVAGTMERCGTTTQVFALVRVLDSWGFRTAVHDASGQLIELMKQCYDDEVEVDAWGDAHLFGISICKVWREGYTAYVRDCGVLTEAMAEIWAEGDISVLVTPTKPWELAEGIQAHSIARKAMPNKLFVVAAFSDEEQVAEMSSVFGDMMLMSWRPDVWDREIPPCYQEAFLPQIRMVCGYD